MGEYYNWVNVDRKEYICPGDFGLGNKRYESLHRANAFLCALRELLATEWKGTHVLFIGDEFQVPADTQNATLRILYDHSVQRGQPGDAFDTICENYRNISSFFKAAEHEVRDEILLYIDDYWSGRKQMYNEYGIDVNRPYKGLFTRDGKDYRYTINRTKRLCYSFEETKILCRDGTASDRFDPLPLLMGYGRSLAAGAWLGDIIGVSDEIPIGYELIPELYLNW